MDSIDAKYRIAGEKEIEEILKRSPYDDNDENVYEYPKKQGMLTRIKGKLFR